MSQVEQAFKIANSNQLVRKSGWEDLTSFPGLNPEFEGTYPGMAGACRMFGCRTPICKSDCNRSEDAA